MVSSFVGRRSLPTMSAYCASKFALEALSESLRVELHDERIAVAVGTRRHADGVHPGRGGTRPANYIHPKKACRPTPWRGAAAGRPPAVPQPVPHRHGKAASSCSGSRRVCLTPCWSENAQGERGHRQAGAEHETP